MVPPELMRPENAIMSSQGCSKNSLTCFTNLRAISVTAAEPSARTRVDLDVSDSSPSGAAFTGQCWCETAGLGSLCSAVSVSERDPGDNPAWGQHGAASALAFLGTLTLVHVLVSELERAFPMLRRRLAMW